MREESNLIGRMTLLGNRLRRMPHRMGVAQYQKQVRVIKHSIDSDASVMWLPSESYLLLEPNPRIEPVSPRLVGTPIDDKIIVSRRDLQVKDIGLNYSIEDLTGEWEIDGVRGYQLLLLRPKTTTYEALLRSPAET